MQEQLETGSTSKSTTVETSPQQQPAIDQATYRDLVIFEERLRGNMTRLQKRKRKYEGKCEDDRQDRNVVLMNVGFFYSIPRNTLCAACLFLLCGFFGTK